MLKPIGYLPVNLPKDDAELPVTLPKIPSVIIESVNDSLPCTKVKPLISEGVTRAKKRNLPKNPTNNFELKSNLESWKSLPSVNPKGKTIFRREQESIIAFFEPKGKAEREKGIIKRRDDFTLGNNKLIEINRLTCLDLVKFSTLLRNKGTMLIPSNVKRGKQRYKKVVIEKTESNLKILESLIESYIQSVRRLGNFCFECGLPLKVKTSKLLEVDKVETRLEKRERQTFRHKMSFIEHGRKFRIQFRDKSSIIKYRKAGESIYHAEIFGCFVIVPTNEINKAKRDKNYQVKIASLEQIAMLEPIQFISPFDNDVPYHISYDKEKNIKRTKIEKMVTSKQIRVEVTSEQKVCICSKFN